jgi:hypothetical protein
MTRIRVPVDERIIEVFHGTSKIRALEAINTQQLYPSKHSWDWLGNGIYFWEKSLLRGIQWARGRWGEHAAVVKTSVRLGCCIDLFDTKWFYALSEAYDSLRREFASKGASLPVNDGESRELDCSLANYLCEKYYDVDTIRAPFFDGEPIFPSSMFYNLTHVQLVVRNSKAIVGPLKLAYGEAPFGERAV